MHRLLALGLISFSASAADLPSVATSEGYDTFLAALDSLARSESKPKKRDKLLTEARLAEVALPARAWAGASLVLEDVTPLTSCRWAEGSLTCQLSARTLSAFEPEGYRLRCRTRFGASIEVAGTAVAAGDRTTWTVARAERCFDLNPVLIRIEPIGTDELDGIGFGTDTLPAEHVELGQEEIRRIIESRSSSYKACYQKSLERRPGLIGDITFEYRISLTGHISRIEPTRHTLDDDETIECIQRRFAALRFPPAHQGAVTGQYTFSFKPPE